MKQYLLWYLVLVCGCTITCSDTGEAKVKHPRPRYGRQYGRDYKKEHASQYGQLYIGNYKMNDWCNVWHHYSHDDISMMGRSARNGYNLQEHYNPHTRTHAVQSASMKSRDRQTLHTPYTSCNTNAHSTIDYIERNSTCAGNSYNTITDVIHNLHHTSAHNAYRNLLRMVVYGELSQSDIIAAFGEVASENNMKQSNPHYLSTLNEVQQRELDNVMLPYGCHLAWAHKVLHDLKKTDTGLQMHQNPASTLVHDINQLHAIVHMCPFGTLPFHTRSYENNCAFVPTYAARVMDDIIAGMHAFPIDHMYGSIMHRVISGDIPKHVVLKSFARVAHAQGQNASSHITAQLTVAQLNAYRYISKISLKNNIQPQCVSPILSLDIARMYDV